MQTFIKSGGAFFVLGVVFMAIGIAAEKPAVYIALGAVWLVVGIGIAAKSRKQSASNQHDQSEGTP